MPVNFRVFRDADISELRHMMSALYSEDPSYKPITEDKISRTITELGRNPCKGQIIIFEKNNETIGYSILVFYWSNEYGGDILHIDELYVKPEHRRHGVATSFFDHVSRKLKDNMVALQLEVTSSNTEVMDYYQKLGFEKMRNLQLMRSSSVVERNHYACKAGKCQ